MTKSRHFTIDTPPMRKFSIRALDQIRQDPSPRLDKDVFATNCKLLGSRINENLRRIERKKQQSSTPITLVPLTNVFEPVTTILSKVNSATKEHNRIVSRFDAERSTLVGQVWHYLARPRDSARRFRLL